MRNHLSEVRLLREIPNQRLNNMAHFTTHTWCRMACISAIALTTFSSCVKDDTDDCIPQAMPEPPKVSLFFDYTYNVKEADAFAAEVKSLNVYAFDEDGKYIKTYKESSDKFKTGHKMEISDLKEGKYTFVCLARDRQVSVQDLEDELEFEFSTLTPNLSTIDELSAKMGKNSKDVTIENDKQFAALYVAQTDVDFRGKNAASTLSLMKCTKTYRIVLLPYENEQEGFSVDNFDVRIVGSAAWLDHQGNKIQNKGITYLPYHQEHRLHHHGETSIDGKPIEQALVYDLSSSRMFEGSDDQRIIITDLRDKDNPKVVFDHSLPWFLALCGERQSKGWKAQEYLDRQDHYILTFYVPDKRDYNLNATVNVNGWNLNLQDTDLGGQGQTATPSVP